MSADGFTTPPWVMWKTEWSQVWHSMICPTAGCVRFAAWGRMISAWLNDSQAD